jgi:hypothetical protein
LVLPKVEGALALGVPGSQELRRAAVAA